MQSWGRNERIALLYGQLPEADDKGKVAKLVINKASLLEENFPLIKVYYTETTSMDVNTALYSKSNGVEM